MASKHLVGYLPRSSEYPGTRREIKRITRKAARMAGQAEIAFQQSGDITAREATRKAVNDRRDELEAYWRNLLEEEDFWEYDSYDPYRGLSPDEMAALAAHWAAPWMDNGSRLTYRLQVA